MKKLILTLATIFLFVFTNSFFVFAESNTSQVSFVIASGLESKSTFDKTRTITGKADEKSTVTINVYEKTLEKEEELKEIETYKIVVGASGYFSQTINLNVGENIIKISVKDKSNNTDSIQASITRKKSEIKNELEQAVILSRVRK